MKTNRLILVVMLLLSVVCLRAQTGPAGVGNSDGTLEQPENVLWLDANDLTSLASGESWIDKSGNNNDAVNNGAPLTVSDSLSYNVVNFAGFDTGNLQVDDTTTFDDISNLDMIIVFEPGLNPGKPRGLISKRTSHTDGNSSFYTYLHASEKLNARVNDDLITGKTSVVSGSPSINHFRYEGGKSLEILLNGVSEEETSNVDNQLINVDEALEIGKLQEGYSAANNFKGLIAEIIIFRDRLSDLQLSLVNSYLETKYGIDLEEVVIAYEPTDDSFYNSVSGTVVGSTTVDYGGSGGLYLSLADSVSGDYVLGAHNNADNDISLKNTGSSVTVNGAKAAWNRVWYVQSGGTSPSIRLSFDLSEGIEGSFPQDITNYVLLKKDSPTGDYSQVTVAKKGVEVGDRIYFEVADANFTDAYYTLGTLDETLSPLDGGDRRIWYTLRASSEWNNPESWTLEPCGCLPNNPEGYTPETSPTSESDKVVILSGNKIIVPAGTNNLINGDLVINGELDLGETLGHAFATITGSGLVSMAADNFPSGDASQFVTEGEGEGKVEFYGSGYNISVDREFFDVDVKLTGTTSQLTLVSDLKVNGDLRIEEGEFIINDNSNTNALQIDVKGDFIVQSNGKVLLGNANARHQLNLLGDFSNEGTVHFTNRNAVDYYTTATDGIVDFNLINPSKNQVVTCNGVTNFYRIEIDKGTDKTYIASINASETSHFNIFGTANDSHASISQLTVNDNALGLLRGTVRIGQNVVVNHLNTGGNYNISSAARLWVDGGTISKESGFAIVPYGEFKLSSGTANVKVSSGITLRDNGIINIEGGELNVNQIRTSVLGSEHQGGYVQSGGVVNVTATSTNSDYYPFNLTFEGNSFQMSGGELNIEQANAKGGIFINSAEANQNVTGGTVNLNIGNSNTFIITSKAPFYNVNLTKDVSNTIEFILDDAVDVGSTDVDLVAQPLVVLNDLSIGENCLLNHDGNDVYIGRNMSIDADATAGSGGTPKYIGYLYNTNKPNTTYFNGTEDGELYIGHNVDDSYEQYFWNVELDKPVGKKLTLKGDLNKQADQVGTNWHARLMLVQNDFNLVKGTFDQGLHSIRLYGPVNISAVGVCGVYEHGITDKNALVMFKDDDVVITTEDGAEFGNIKMNPAANRVITFYSDVVIRRISFHQGRIDMGTHNLKVDYFHRGGTLIDYTVDRGSLTEMFISEGNASDGGLSLYVPAGIADGTKLAFPLGYGSTGASPESKYTYAEAELSNVTDDGYITINIVNKALATLAGGSSDVLQYYWSVEQSGFDNAPNVEFQFQYSENDIDGTDTLYVPGRVVDYIREEDTSGSIDTLNNIITFSNAILKDGDYTCGIPAKFGGDINVYYTRDISREPRWTNTNAWTRSDLLDPLYEPHDSRQPAAGDYPQEGDIAIIGWVPWGNTTSSGDEGEPHGMWIDGSSETVAELVFTPMEDVDGNPVARVYRSSFQFRPTLCINGSGSLTASRVSGEGMFWNRNGDPDFSLMDIGDFAASDSSYIVYENNVNNKEFVNAPSEFPNLMVANDGWGGNDRNLTFPHDIVTNGNLEILGDANLVLSSGATGDITVGEDLLLFEVTDPLEGNASGGGARLDFPNSVSRTVVVKGDLILSNTGAIVSVLSPDNDVTTHTLAVSGSIYQKSNGGSANGLKLWTADDEDNITLILDGDEDMTYTHIDGDVPDFYRIVVDKGSSIDTELNFDGAFTLNGPTSGEGVDKALELLNGLFVVNNAATVFNLSTGDDDFVINNTSGLAINEGTLSLNGTSNLSLDGLLRISGGTLDMSGGDNAIIYSVSGNAEIEITDGTLKVGSQIRRPETDDLGVLKYNQSGGIVEIGVSSGGLDSRAMLEVLNTGSSFYHTGGSLTFVRQNTASPSIAALLLEPSSYSTEGSQIYIFNDKTPIGQNSFQINSSILLNDLSIGGVNSPGVELTVRPLNVEGELNINSGATFNANGLTMNLLGDFVVDGDFQHSSNTVNFIGLSPQLLSGSATFYQLNKSQGGDELLLDSDITVEYELSLVNGSINDGGNSIFVKRDISNSGEFVSGGGDGVVLNGTTSQRLYGEGTYDRLYLDNSSGFTQEDGNVIEINEQLDMEAGILDIGKNLIVFNQDAVIMSTAGFDETNMIQTNISFVDAGLKKFLNSGTESFIFPLGSGGIYTPVTLNILTNSSTQSYLRIKGAKEVHPSVVDDVDTAWDETENVLNYYWVIDADGFTDFTGNITMEYPNSLVSVTEPGKTYDDYITARLLSRGTGDWNKDVGAVDTTNDILTFDFLNATDDDGLVGDYTAGLDDAIPDQVPTYTSILDGDWNDVSIWSPQAPVGGPRGALVIINTDVDVPIDYISSYKTTINGENNGRILILGTEGHRLGNVYGTGTLYLETGSLPAGDYTDFFIADGGTVEFGGDSKEYPVLSGVTEVNNIKFSGTGTRDLANNDLSILGDLIFETNGTLLVDNKYDKTIQIKGDLEFNSGTFDSGQGDNATLVFNGTTRQLIKGTSSLTGENALYNLTISNAAGVNAETNIEVDRILNLTNGIFNTELGDLTLTYSEVDALQGGSSAAFVEGPLSKSINHNESFDFPIGRSGRYGTIKIFNTDTESSQLWKAQYFNNSPTIDGYDASSQVSPLAFVNQNEYWTILGPDGKTAKVKMTWDSESGVNPDSNTRIAEWKDLTTDAWTSTSIVDLTGSSSAGSITTENAITFNEFANGNIITFGSILIPAYNWLGVNSDWFDISNWTGGSVPSASSDVTIDVSSIDPVIDPSISSSVVQVNDLTIDSGASLTLSPGSRVTVNGNLVTNDGLIIQNSTDLPSSFIPLGSVTGNVNIDWTYSSRRYWYIGHSTANPVMSSYDDLLASSNDYFLYHYPYPEDSWVDISKSSHAFDDELNGYSVIFKDEATVYHSGELNNDAEYTRTLQGDSEFLVANPYSSYLDFSKTSEWEFGTADETVYTRTDLPGDIRGFATYNVQTGVGANGGSRFVVPGQSFWVYSYNSPNDFTVKSGARTHTETMSLKSTSTEEPDDVLRIEMSNDYTTDEAILVFREIGSEQTTSIDSKKRMSPGDNIPNLYSMKGSDKITINVLPEMSEEYTIPLGYTIDVSGVATISISNLASFMPNVEIYLVDNAYGVSTNLREQSYEFLSSAGGEYDRFELTFKKVVEDTDVPTEIPESAETEVNAYAYYKNNKLTVVENILEDGVEGKIFIKVTDIRGVELYNTISDYSGRHLIDKDFNSGVYIVSISSGNNKRLTCKVIVN